LVIVFVHRATAFGDFFSYVSDIISRQLTFCERVIASLLCVIFDIYRSPAYVYGGHVRRCGIYTCIPRPTFPVLQFPVLHFPSRIFRSSIFHPAFLVLQFPVLHFPVPHFQSRIFQYCIFGPSNLTPLVSHFPVLHFPVPHFPRPLMCLVGR